MPHRDTPAVVLEQQKPFMRVRADRLAMTLRCEGGFEIHQMEDTVSGRRWIGDDGPTTGLWRITFRGPDGTTPAYTPGFAAFVGVETESRVDGGSLLVRAVWNAPLAPGAAARVVVEVRFEADSPLSRWRLLAGVPDGWSIVQHEFPTVDGLRTSPDLRAVVPMGWGVERAFAPGYFYEGGYPGCLASMQLITVHDGACGLYLATHDSAACLKTLRLTAAMATGTYNVQAVPEIRPGRGHDRVSPVTAYDSVIGVYGGDYLEAGRIYREFAIETPWGKAANWSKRFVPKWLRETDIWLRPDGGPHANVDVTRDGLEYFGADHTSLHWYRWHKIPYDTNYPEYLPALDGFAEAIAEMQRLGTRVMPYINGRLWDPASRSWREEGAAESAARRDTGDCYTEVYGSKVPNSVMCPATPQWQAKVRDVVGSLFTELGVNGVYIDQIGAASGVPCHAQTHGHAPGGGSFWHTGYRQLLEGVRGIMPPDTIITTEENAECWIDQFDALLVVNTPSNEGEPVPMFPAVYADRTVTFGFMYYPAAEPGSALSFRLKNARAFLWGAQIGWIQPSRIMPAEFRAEAAFLRELAECRRHARPYLLGGCLEAVLRPAGDMPMRESRGPGSFGGSYAIHVAAVLATLWRGPDGRLAVLAANHTDQAVTARFALPAGVGDVWSVAGCADGGTASGAKRDGDALVLEMAAASAVLVEIGGK